MRTVNKKVIAIALAGRERLCIKRKECCRKCGIFLGAGKRN